MSIIEGEEKKKGLENIYRQIMDENFPNLRNELELGIQEVYRTPNYLDPKRHSPRHIVLKLSKINDKKSSQGSQGEENCNLQRKTHYIVIKLLSTNLTIQKGIESNV